MDLEHMSNEELWELFPILLNEYQPAWADRYLLESKRLTNAIGPDTISRIHHIGSTSVPGLSAKPTKMCIRDSRKTGLPLPDRVD